ncbi:peroxiredoxin [Burkholderia pyrrocinia]|uniref:OsmC family protein n=1 Tax=Burkholderia stagnalis TaxID=1503054 RepID=UPI00075EA6D7|nr:OsmC family protein [Burkholderia stagnalis]KVN24968.1 peroxiredoxin [Burkholderia pyrrocinia]WGS44682.1 OsmC family protein [Burkholderia sp. JSH-S8]
MATARREGERYRVALTAGRHRLVADTCKDGIGGNAGMRPHELLECAMAACICMSLDRAADRACIALPAATIDVTVVRRETDTCFNVHVRFDAALSDDDREMVRAAVLGSPVARTLGKPVHVVLSAIDARA